MRLEKDELEPTHPAEPTDDDPPTDEPQGEGEAGDDELGDDFATEHIEVDTPADLEVDDASLEWSQDDDDLGEEGTSQ